MKNNSKQQTIVLTIGHSTHPIDEFIDLLKAHDVKKLVDVRTIPKSRHNPQFNQETLSERLRDAGIMYVHMPGLGGLRHTVKDSLNTGWRNPSFRGFADYMQTGEFEKNLEELIEISKKQTTVIMCAEAVPWRCHRSLIADALLVRGVKVEDIIGTQTCRPHDLTPWVKVNGKRVTYPPE
jgi:uncharacterized protein (DUF488 family)